MCRGGLCIVLVSIFLIDRGVSDSVENYLKHFEWNIEQFDSRDALRNLVKRMQTV